MRVYFLSAVPAALKLNGEYAGIIDLFERYVEIDAANGIFTEIVPDDNLQPLNFIFNEKFLKSPPGYADVYKSESETLIYFRSYRQKDNRLCVLGQKRLGRCLATVFRQGGIYVSCECENTQLYELTENFSEPVMQIVQTCGTEFLSVQGKNCLALFSEDGRQTFSGEGESFEFGDNLTAEVKLSLCTKALKRTVYKYDGEKFYTVKSQVIEESFPRADIMHFAFFEAVMTGKDCAEYLCDALKPKAASLKKYLGDFSAVVPPSELFYKHHKDKRAVGLVYRKGENLFEVRYFIAETADGKVENIYPCN